MKISSRVYCVIAVFLFVGQSYLTAQDRNGGDTYSNNNKDVNITKYYIEQQTNIYNKKGLSEEEKIEFQKLQESNDAVALELESLKNQVETNSIRQQEYESLLAAKVDSDKRIKELEEKNKQMVRLMFEDTTYRTSLELQYDELLRGHLGSYWEANPDLNPNNNVKCVEMYEELSGTKVANLVVHNFVYEYLKCNACVRDNPQAWNGVNVGGTFYYFAGTGLNVVGGPPRKNIGQLSIYIPKEGVFTIFELREHFAEYWNLKKDRKAKISEQMRKRALTTYEIRYNLDYEKDTDCTNGFGTILVKNRTGNDIKIWLCEGENSPCNGVSWSQHTLSVSSGKVMSYKLPGKIYTYAGYLGGGKIHGLISIPKCEVEELIFE